MREKPILFSGPMVRAILDGRKTQTRRVVKPQPVEMVRFLGADNEPTWEFGWCPHERVITKHVRCPYGLPGDRLWVRETFSHCYNGAEAYQVIYASDGSRRDFSYGTGATEEQLDWLERGMGQHGESGRPGIHLPRWASRITLEVTLVRVERLQEINARDAVAEGIPLCEHGFHYCTRGCQIPTQQFQRLWDSINAKRAPWSSNPWVWVIEFRPTPEAARG